MRAYHTSIKTAKFKFHQYQLISVVPNLMLNTCIIHIHVVTYTVVQCHDIIHEVDLFRCDNHELSIPCSV